MNKGKKKPKQQKKGSWEENSEQICSGMVFDGEYLVKSPSPNKFDLC